MLPLLKCSRIQIKSVCEILPAELNPLAEGDNPAGNGINDDPTRQLRLVTDAVETLERVAGIRGTTKTIRFGNGPKLICKALDLRAWLNGVTQDFSRPGKLTDNAFIESFNR